MALQYVRVDYYKTDLSVEEVVSVPARNKSKITAVIFSSVSNKENVENLMRRC